jgi:FG-GAP-like repeat/Bacterial Ig-like domain (group 3)
MTRAHLPRFLAAALLALISMALVALQSTSQMYSPQHRAGALSRPEARPRQPVSISKPAGFTRAVIYSTGGNYAFAVAIKDLNGDGKPDLAVADLCQTGSDGNSDCDSGGAVGVLLGNGDGTFQPSVTYSSGGTAASSVAIADVNGDGFPDLLVANQCESSTDCTNGVIGVLLGNGDGTFRPPVAYSAGNGAQSIAVADLNGDGHPDLAVANACLSANSCDNGGVSILIGNGHGTFQAATTYNSGGQNALSIAISDLNGDSAPDVIVANQCFSKFKCSNGGVSVLLGNGNGTLQSSTSYSSGGYSALSIAAADVNDDGRPDILATSLCSDSNNCVEGVVGVLVGKGDGTVKPPVTYSSNGYGASSLAVGDMNGDGITDLVVDNICKTSSNCAKGGIGVLLGNGDGTFQAPILYSSDGNDATSVATADLNGDGKLDIVTANDCTSKSNCNGIVAVLLNSSVNKTTTTLSSAPNPSAVGQPVTLTATTSSTLSIPDGEVVTFYQGSLELGAGTTRNGIAILTTSFSQAGTFTIKAKYPGDAFHKSSSGKVKQTVN